MISIIIPCYEMHGKGVEFLSELLESIVMQKYSDYEVIITDNSEDHAIEVYLQENWETDDFTYVRNDNKGFAANMNYGMKFAKGEIIKPMAQDDTFLDKHTLGNIAASFNSPNGWTVCRSVMKGMEDWVHYPHNHRGYKELLEGENTYGCPSAIAFLKCELEFDQELIWLMDCDFYARLVKKFGWPAYLDDGIMIRQWHGQITRNEGVGQIRLNEQEYCRKKHLITNY